MRGFLQRNETSVSDDIDAKDELGRPMLLSLKNVRAGLVWTNESFWGPRILNPEYYDIYGDRSQGVTDEWWSATVARLGKWTAYRGPKPPNSKVQIIERGREILQDLSDAYEAVSSASTGEPSIASLSWEEVEPVFNLAWRVKPSPVFASKLSHFLLPNVFIVMDNQATQVFEYEFYWRGMKDEWDRFADRSVAVELVCTSIVCDLPVHDRYPFTTKVMEISHIGYRHPTVE